MNGQCRLSVFEGREFLRISAWNSRVAQNDFFNQSSHGFNTEGKRSDVEQQPVVSRGTVSRQKIGLHGSAKCDNLFRIDCGMRFFSEQFLDLPADMGHACRTSDQDDSIDIVNGDTCIAYGFFDLLHGSTDKRMRHLFEYFCRQFQIDFLSRRKQGVDCNPGTCGKPFFCFTRLGHQKLGIFGRKRFQMGFFNNPAKDPVIEIIPAES